MATIIEEQAAGLGPYVLIVDDDFNFQYATTEAADLFGYTTDELEQVPQLSTMTPARREAVWSAIAEDGFAAGVEEVERKDGSRFMVVYAVRCVCDGGPGDRLFVVALRPEDELEAHGTDLLPWLTRDRVAELEGSSVAAIDRARAKWDATGGREGLRSAKRNGGVRIHRDWYRAWAGLLVLLLIAFVAIIAFSDSSSDALMSMATM